MTSQSLNRPSRWRPRSPTRGDRAARARIQRLTRSALALHLLRSRSRYRPEHRLFGRPYAGQTVTAHVSDSAVTVELDGQVRVIRRTTDVPVRNVKANKPHGAPYVV
ncbi:hypothetical protein GQF42_16550 [Streptomyces broussonetiae]|uniref:Uncharacterized protein n=1 Tax=Streptomyces broussonetiae TaxID=2686304 RepID=A0A6I6MVE1_9ACTN|nr:hypothetical protein GQF42_16550 [Streptomyces broussonetiae]